MHCTSLNSYLRLAILLNIFRFSAKFLKTNLKKKNFHYFVELIETNPLMYNTLQYDQYSRLAILVKKFGFLPKI